MILHPRLLPRSTKAKSAKWIPMRCYVASHWCAGHCCPAHCRCESTSGTGGMGRSGLSRAALARRAHAEGNPRPMKRRLCAALCARGCLASEAAESVVRLAYCFTPLRGTRWKRVVLLFVSHSSKEGPPPPASCSGIRGSCCTAHFPPGRPPLWKSPALDWKSPHHDVKG